MSSPPVISCFSSAGIARRSHTRWNICRPFSISWGHFPFWLLTLSPLHFNSSLKICRRGMFQKAEYSSRLVSVSFPEKYMPPRFFPHWFWNSTELPLLCFTIQLKYTYNKQLFERVFVKIIFLWSEQHPASRSMFVNRARKSLRHWWFLSESLVEMLL